MTSSSPALSSGAHAARASARPGLLDRLASPLTLLALTVLVRSAGLLYGVVDIDETDFLTIARMMNEGATLYVETLDKKPPLSFAWYALVGPLGESIIPAQLFAMAWLFATAWVTGRAAERWFARREARVVASYLVVLISAANVFSVNAELMLNLPAACALLFFARAEESRRIREDVAAGAFVGLASLFKHQGGILLGALGLAILLAPRNLDRIPRRLLRGTALAAGFLAPWAAAIAFFAALGHLDAFLEWNFTRNLSYVGGSAGSATVRALEALLVFVVLGAPVPWLLAIRTTAARPTSTRGLALALALWLTWIPVALGGRFYAHYFIQFAPPLALAATPGLLLLLDVWPSLEPIRRHAVVLGLALPIVIHQTIGAVRFLVGDFPGQDEKARTVAAFLRANTDARDRLFVWGHFTPVYYLAGRLPGTRYVHTSVHLGDYDPMHLPPGFDIAAHRSARDIEATLADLEKNRPAIVVDTSPADIHGFSRVPLSAIPELEGYVKARYELIGTPAGAAVYRRRSEVTSSSSGGG